MGWLDLATQIARDKQQPPTPHNGKGDAARAALANLDIPRLRFASWSVETRRLCEWPGERERGA